MGLTIGNNIGLGQRFQQGANVSNILPSQNIVQHFDGTIASNGLEYIDRSGTAKNLKVVRNSCYLLQTGKTTTYPTQINCDTEIITIEALYKRVGTSTNCYLSKFATKGVVVYFQNSTNSGRISYRIFGATASLAANADTGILLTENVWTKVKFVIQSGVAQGVKVYLNDEQTPSFAGGDTRSLGSINYGTSLELGGASASICRLSVKNGNNYNLFAPCSEGFGLTSYDISGNGNHGIHNAVNIANRNANSNYQDAYNYNNLNPIDVFQSANSTFAGNTIAKPAKDLNGNAISYIDRETATYGAYSLLYSTDITIPGIHKSDSLYKLQASTENIASDYQNFWFDSGGVAIAHTWDEIVGLKAKWFADKNSKHVIRTLAGYSTSLDASGIVKANKFCRNNPVEIWIQAGESLAAASMTGLSTLPADMLKESYHAKVWNGTTFVTINTTLSTHYYPGGSTTYYSTLLPFQHFRSTEGRETWFIHLGVGGARIYQDGAQSYNWNVNTVGGSYQSLKTLITNALAWLDKYNVPYTFKGVIWQQGANDCGATYTATFKQNTIDLIAGLRTHLSVVVPFYIVQTANYNADAPTVRTAQSQICTEVVSCVLIEDTGASYSDGIHLNTDGKLLIAQRIADRII